MKRSWTAKFRDAFRGVSSAMRGDSSFTVHLLTTVAVFVAAVVFRVSRFEWGLLLMCVGVVLAAETFNSAIEAMAKSITAEHDENIGRALDMAAGAVLIVAFAAAAVGLLIFIPHAVALTGIGQ